MLSKPPKLSLLLQAKRKKFKLVRQVAMNIINIILAFISSMLIRSPSVLRHYVEDVLIGDEIGLLNIPWLLEANIIINLAIANLLRHLMKKVSLELQKKLGVKS